jgi:hypothetical protein
MCHVKSSYLVLADNLMDLTHLAYVHPTNVGGTAQPIIDAEMDVKPTDRGVSVKRSDAGLFAAADLPQECLTSGSGRSLVGIRVSGTCIGIAVERAVPAGTGARDPAKRDWSRSEGSDGFAAQSLSKFRATRGQYHDVNVTREYAFLHYAFDVWMRRTHPDTTFAYYGAPTVSMVPGGRANFLGRCSFALLHPRSLAQYPLGRFPCIASRVGILWI